MSDTASPLSFEVDSVLHEQLELLSQLKSYQSVSSLVRDAVETYEFTTEELFAGPRRQLSVRLDSDKKDELAKVAKESGVSVAKIIRYCLEKLIKSHQASIPITNGSDPMPCGNGKKPFIENEQSSSNPSPSPIFDTPEFKIERSSFRDRELLNFILVEESFSLDETQLRVVYAASREIYEYLLSKESKISSIESEDHQPAKNTDLAKDSVQTSDDDAPWKI